jgi:superoxide dismutase, Cu-Zn family
MNLQHRRIFVGSAAAAVVLVAGCGERETPPAALGTAVAQQSEGPEMQRQVGATASAEFIGLDGERVGQATLEEGPEGVFIRGELTGLEPGGHGFHVHQVGRCEPPFETAGGHYNPDGRQHGLLNPAGAHAGDMANIFADAAGNARIEALAPKVSIRGGANALLDGDGTALMVHSGEDDHRTDPAGDAGDRIACAVIR